jgi:hypothetical protein
MSNKFLIPLIIILSLITIGVASLTQLNKGSGKVTINQSSEVISSLKTEAMYSSSSVQTQVYASSVVSSAQKVMESVKVESQPVISITSKCNLPESENLVKTEDGCFEKIIWTPNEGLLPSDPNFVSIKKIENEILIDYFQKVKANFISDKKIINLVFYKKKDNSNYEMSLSVQDIKLLLQMYPNLTEIGGPYSLFPYKYSINIGKDNKITYTATKSQPN